MLVTQASVSQRSTGRQTAVMDAEEADKEVDLEAVRRLVELRGIEPLTSAVRLHRIRTSFSQFFVNFFGRKRGFYTHI